MAKVSSSVAATPEKKAKNSRTVARIPPHEFLSKERVKFCPRSCFGDKLRLVEHCFLFCCGKVSKVVFCVFSFFNVPRKTRKLHGIQT